METAWQHSDSFSSTNIAMLDNKILCDVTLVAKNSTDPIKCHKFFLVSRSPVFEAMFCGPLAETSDVINIPDIEESILKSFVRYLYSGVVEITAETVLHLMYAAKKYDVLGLQTKCRSFLDIEMSVENVCTVLDQAITFDDMDLQKICLNFIMRQSEDVLETESFVEMSRSALKEILMCDNFGTSECELFNGCKRWAKHACKSSGRNETDSDIRDVLGKELIELIRFPAMSAKEFAENVAETSLLCQSDIIAVFRSISTQKNVSSFKSEPRISLTIECLFKRCETFAVGYGSQLSGKGENFSFSVSHDCALSGVAICLPSNGGSANAKSEIFEDGVKVHSIEVTLNFNESQFEVVKIVKPIPLFKGKLYKINVLHSGQMVFCCHGFKKEVKHNGVTLVVAPESEFCPLIPALELVIDRS